MGRSDLDTDEGLQELYVRLLKRWDEFWKAEAVGQSSELTRMYFAFAAQLIRDIIVDTIRKRFGRGKQPRPRHTSLEELANDADNSAAAFDPAETTHDPEKLVRWAEVHEYLGNLPEPLRQVVDLHYYHGLTHAEVGNMLNIVEVTSRKHGHKFGMTCRPGSECSHTSFENAFAIARCRLAETHAPDPWVEFAIRFGLKVSLLDIPDKTQLDGINRMKIQVCLSSSQSC